MSGGAQSVIEVLGALAVAALSSVVTLIISRKPVQVTAEAAWQTAMNDGFKKLSEQYEARNQELGDQVTRLEGTVNNLVQHVESLETILRANGLPIPLRPVPVAELVAPKLVNATVRR